MKTCSTCSKSKPLDEFHKNATKPDGRTSYCKECKKLYNVKYYKRTKHIHNPGRKERRERQGEAIDELRFDYLDCHPCVDCGTDDKLVLEFDHVRGKKEFSIANAKTLGLSLEKVMAEIEKCEVVCANCHRRRTYERGDQANWRKETVVDMRP